MRRRKGLMALEAISFQPIDRFNQLVSGMCALRGTGAGLSNETYFDSAPVKAFAALIKKLTGIQYTIVDGALTGPATTVPMLTGDTVLWSNEEKALIKEVSKSGGDLDIHSDIRPYVKLLKHKFTTGFVDFKNATVGGVFEEMTFMLALPRCMLESDVAFSAEEVVAAVLHEIGHTFSFMEFISRTMTTNQALAGMMRAVDGTLSADQRTIIFGAGADLLKMTTTERQALMNATNKADVTCVVLDSAIQHSVSELGVSIYDDIAAEYLADQFAARHGAGRYLVTALDKFRRYAGWERPGVGHYLLQGIATMLTICALLWVTFVTLGTFWLFMVFAQDKKGQVYDNDKTRFLRIKQQNIERLKNRAIPEHEKKILIEHNEAIDKVLAFYSDNLPFLEKMAYYLRPSFRDAHKFERLQKDLELMGNNDLFGSAAKLSLI